MIPVALIGGGGHAQSVIEIIESQGEFTIEFLWDPALADDGVMGYVVKKESFHMADLLGLCPNIVIAVGQTVDPGPRIHWYHEVKKHGGQLPNILSPQACISKHARLGEGIVVMHTAVINAGSQIGNNCIVNTAAVVEHGAVVEDHSHISTHAVVNGNCRVGAGSLIGSNATVKEKVAIGKGNIIGAGSVVLSNTLDDSTYVGNPARLVKTD